ncbi:hypothetical protein CDEST_04067 [Colletotrichum destructivum]|uniref:Uncharacterized protein n=1 Tax=Colletotrichum destructivum TaxID=34406 RepID=A0AAX4I6P3_9PEZI|nr:hypothetical protein CDEST_04067 [Colletotrichum destructivum]
MRCSVIKLHRRNLLLPSPGYAIAVFNYLHHPDVLPTVHTNRQNLIGAARFLAGLITEFANLEALIMEFDSAWYEEAASNTRNWVDDMLNEMEQALVPLVLSGRAPPNTAAITAYIARLRIRRGDIKASPRKQ